MSEVKDFDLLPAPIHTLTLSSYLHSIPLGNRFSVNHFPASMQSSQKGRELKAMSLGLVYAVPLPLGEG